jgi:rhamnosyltransferase
MKLAGVVILYNPEDIVLNNIKTYLKELDVLYVFDNSDCFNKHLIRSLQNIKVIKYISFHRNCGIAFALNFVLKHISGYNYLLTMDQDSSFDVGMMKRYKMNIMETENKNIAVFSINWRKSQYNNPYKYINNAITSGAIINVDLARELGGFDENLFIDQVDFEYCYRAQKNGHYILQFNNITLNHHLGTVKQYVFLGIHFSLRFHDALRNYYICRNNLYVMKRYPQVRFNYSKDMIKLFIVSILFGKNRFHQLKYWGRAIYDFYYHKWGKLDRE